MEQATLTIRIPENVRSGGRDWRIARAELMTGYSRECKEFRRKFRPLKISQQSEFLRIASLGNEEPSDSSSRVGSPPIYSGHAAPLRPNNAKGRGGRLVASSLRLLPPS